MINKSLIYIGFSAVLLSVGMVGAPNIAFAQTSSWEQFSNWFKDKNAEDLKQKTPKKSKTSKPAQNLNPQVQAPEIKEPLKRPVQVHHVIALEESLESAKQLPLKGEITKEEVQKEEPPKQELPKKLAPKPMIHLNPIPKWDNEKTILPSAIEGTPYQQQIDLKSLLVDSKQSSEVIFTLNQNHPNWLQLSADGQSLEGNAHNVTTKDDTIEVIVNVANADNPNKSRLQTLKVQIDHQGSVPHWSISSFPDVAIAQKSYQDLNLNEFISTHIPEDRFIFTLTPGKANPNWITLFPDGLLHLNTEKISPEDINTIQVIYLTATSTSGKSTESELTIKITPNEQSPAPEWLSNFTPTDAIPAKPYKLNLAAAIDTTNLPENDQLTFQIVHSSANWLQMGEDGFSITAQQVPQIAANRSFDLNLRATSKISGKSTDFTTKIFVNPIPQPLQWQPIPQATINKNYSIDLSNIVKSNIRNDQFFFQIDVANLPSWLSIHNNHILTGTPFDAQLLDQPQKVSVTATSLLTGMSGSINLSIQIRPDQQLAPTWKKDILSSPIINETYRSEDLNSLLDNRYANDQLSFEYVSGPEWMTFNDLCHCLISKGNVPADAAGKTFN